MPVVLLRDLGKVLRLRPVLVHVLDAGPSEHLCCDWLGLEAGHLREDLDVLVQGVRAVVELSGGKWSMSYLKNAWEMEKKNRCLQNRWEYQHRSQQLQLAMYLNNDHHWQLW